MRKLVWFAAAFAAACGLYLYWLCDLRLLWLALGFLLVSVAAAFRKLPRLRLAALGAAFGILWCICYQQVILSPARQLAQQEHHLTVTVQEPPRASQQGSSVEVLLSTRTRSLSAMLYASELPACSPGDRLSGLFLVEPSGVRIADDESLYLQSKGISLCLYDRSDLTVEQGQPAIGIRIRLWLQNRISRLYDGETAGFVRALLTGDRSGLSYATRNQLAVSGISHAVAVSGMHVSMLLMLLSFLFGGNPRLTALCGIPLVILFAVMTGASASVCRSAAMNLFLLTAPLVRRESDPPTNLACAGLLLLLENPWSIANVSFQLSFASVAGLVLFAGPIQKKILSVRKHPGWLLKFLASSLSASLSASLLTLPLTVWYFKMVSLAAPLTNLLVLWAVTFIFTLGLLSAILVPIGAILVFPVRLLTEGLLLLCRSISSFPYAAAYPHNPILMTAALLAYAVFALVLLCKRLRGRIWYLSAITALLLFSVVAGRWPLLSNTAVLTALDVGQGQCLLFQRGSFAAVIDCGGPNADAAGEQAAQALHSAGISQVDAVILTHFDADHCGGVPQLLDRVTVDRIIMPDLDVPAKHLLLEEAAAHDTAVTLLTTEALIRTNHTSMWLFPQEKGKIGNEASLCLLATAAEYDILITGDLSSEGELALLARYPLPTLDLLVVGHHGSAGSTCDHLLQTLQPKTALISAGKNSYGLPAEETLTRLRKARVRLLRTDRDGTIVIPIS